MNNLNFIPTAILEKRTKPKASRRKKIIKIREEIIEIQTKKKIEKINET